MKAISIRQQTEESTAYAGLQNLIPGRCDGLRPAKELAATRPHGDRLRYMAGCRCTPCRAANSAYETERAKARRRGEWNGLVPAEKARLHLLRLTEAGIGRDTVADITGLCVTTISEIRTGRQKNLRALNEKAILAISPDDVVNDAQLIPARETWTRIRWLIREGFSKAEIARRLGYKTPNLQLNKHRIMAKTAMRIEKLYNSVRLGGEEGD